MSRYQLLMATLKYLQVFDSTSHLATKKKMEPWQTKAQLITNQTNKQVAFLTKVNV